MSISRSKSKPRQDALGNKIPDPMEELALIEREIHEIKVAFETYFLGIERRAPTRRRDVLREKLRKFRASGSFKTPVHRYRLEQLASKFAALDRLWTRTLSEMERGTYRRDLNRMKRRQEQAAPAQAPGSAAAGAGQERRSDLPLSDGQMRELYDAYISARKVTGQTSSNVTLEALANTIRKQAPEIMKRHNCSGVDFKVVIKDGRALLRAVPRR